MGQLNHKSVMYCLPFINHWLNEINCWIIRTDKCDKCLVNHCRPLWFTFLKGSTFDYSSFPYKQPSICVPKNSLSINNWALNNTVCRKLNFSAWRLGFSGLPVFYREEDCNFVISALYSVYDHQLLLGRGEKAECLTEASQNNFLGINILSLHD